MLKVSDKILRVVEHPNVSTGLWVEAQLTRAKSFMAVNKPS
jgi:hypothetical protein